MKRLWLSTDSRQVLHDVSNDMLARFAECALEVRSDETVEN